MNKYKEAARKAQKSRRLARMCTGKKRYDSETAAQQKGQRHYHCPHCHGWHRSGQFAELVHACRTANREPRTLKHSA